MPSITPTAIRRKGLLRLLLGLGAFAVFLTIPLFVLPYFHQQLTPPAMIPFALPGAYALAGLIEVVTGVSFLDFARRWDQLQGWQRGVFGTALVLVALFLIITIFAWIATRL